MVQLAPSHVRIKDFLVSGAIHSGSIACGRTRLSWRRREVRARTVCSRM